MTATLETSFDFSQIVEPVKEMLEKYKNLPNIEVEGRLGIYDNETNRFDTNIGEEYYDSIKDLLESCNKWDKVNDINVTDYFNDKLRLTVDNKTAQQCCIEKKKLASFTFVNENCPLDFRISISKEDPVRVEKFPTKGRQNMKQREKSRKQHTFKEFSYDLTKVSTKNKNKTAEEYFEYEVESIANVNTMDAGNTVFSIILKLLDATYACEGFVKTDENQLPMDNLNIHMIKQHK